MAALTETQYKTLVLISTREVWRERPTEATPQFARQARKGAPWNSEPVTWWTYYDSEQTPTPGWVTLPYQPFRVLERLGLIQVGEEEEHPERKRITRARVTLTPAGEQAMGEPQP